MKPKQTTQVEHVVFRSTINLNSEYRDRYYDADQNDFSNLKRGRFYKFGFQDDYQKVGFEEISESSRRVIEKDLLPNVNDILVTPVLNVRINTIHEGSIEIIFTVLLNSYLLISSLSGFRDSIAIIKDVADNLLKKKLGEKYGHWFNVNTYCIAPSDYDRNHDHYCKADKCKQQFHKVKLNGCIKRDAFFYYLLGSNIILVSIILYLTWKAIVTTYGW